MSSEAADEEKKEDSIKIEDKSKITIRVLKETEIEKADHIVQKAFGLTQKYVTCNQYLDELYVAEYEQKLVGFAMAQHWGSFRVWRAVCVLPQYQKNGIGFMLVDKINDSLKETDKNGAIKRDVLSTSVGTHHIGFYMKFGMLPKYLSYVTRFDIVKSYDALIKNKHNILNVVHDKYSFKDVLSDSNDEQLSEFISSSKEITNEIYKGLDVSVTIKGFAKMKNAKIGTCVGLYNVEEKGMCGFGIIAFGESSEAKKGTMRITFAATNDYKHLGALIYHIIEYSKQMEIAIIETEINMARINAFSILIEKFGFEFDAKNPHISMGKTTDNEGNYDDYNHSESYILGDWQQ